eukprot:SAG11_NODE_146_length_14788_cov_5.672884_4_plen_168_part_00
MPVQSVPLAGRRALACQCSPQRETDDQRKEQPRHVEHKTQHHPHHVLISCWPSPGKSHVPRRPCFGRSGRPVLRRRLSSQASNLSRPASLSSAVVRRQSAELHEQICSFSAPAPSSKLSPQESPPKMHGSAWGKLSGDAYLSGVSGGACCVCLSLPAEAWSRFRRGR